MTPDPATPSTHRVLVVDDNEDAASMLSLIVQMIGNEVRTALDGRTAIELAKEFQPHVVLMDLGMPHMDGFATARHIRSQPWGQDMFLVALTGWSQDDDKRKSAEAGFDHHLVKPTDPATLRALFARVGRKPA